MGKSVQPKRDKTGYYRQVGYLQEGSRSQPKFRLGKDEIEATERLARIMRLWQWRIDQQPERDWGSFLDIARAIARGESEYVVAANRFSNDGAYQMVIEAWQNPVVPVVAEDKHKQHRGQFELDALDTILQANLKRRNKDQEQPQAVNEWRQLVGKRPVKGSLHALLNAYSQLCEKNYHDTEYDTISDNGKMRQRHCKRLLILLPDVPLSRLDYTELDDVFNTLRSRPKKDDGEPFAANYCRHLMQTLTRVLNWADTSQDYGWELPPKFNRISKIVQRLELDNEQDIETPTYTIKELTVLWQLARPNERLLLALALNCGMGADQIGRLTMNRIHLHDDRPSYIKSRRYKKNVIGHWRLWGATKTLIQWAIETRPEAARDHNLLVVNSKGKSLYGKSKNGDRSRQIANAWYRLLDRAEKKKPGFRRLGFNSLRDTSAQFVRNAGGGELATIQLAHKHNTSDSQLGCYTNPNFKRLARCHSHLEAKRFAPLWEAVPDPTELPPRQNSRAFVELAV